jgi:hypothetical protein
MFDKLPAHRHVLAKTGFICMVLSAVALGVAVWLATTTETGAVKVPFGWAIGLFGVLACVGMVVMAIASDRIRAERTRRYTHDEVARAIQDGVDIVTAGLSLGEQETDAIDLAMHAALDRLDNPDADLDSVVSEHYTGKDPRTWWSWSRNPPASATLSDRPH